MQTTLERERAPVRNLSVRGSSAWLDWLGRLARHARLPCSTLVDQAVIEHAKRLGFEEPAPER